MAGAVGNQASEAEDMSSYSCFNVDVEVVHPKPEDLVAKSIAPVKGQYLCSPPLRPASDNGVNESSDKEAPSSSIIVKEKKSKRQIKKERQQARKSTQNFCSEVAKTGDVNACPYGDKCCFSHDLDAFQAQKPDDLSGICPFMSLEYSWLCPYGVACRFSRTHKACANESFPGKNVSELNYLNKNVQKLLWKNKWKFTLADAHLKVLGLWGRESIDDMKNRKEEDLTQNDDKLISDGSNDQRKIDVRNLIDDITDEMESCPGLVQPLKKSKNLSNDEISSDIHNNCVNAFISDVQNFGEIPELDVNRNKLGLSEVDTSLEANLCEKKLIDFRGKLYLAPLTTVGNLPFRRVCKVLGADITCGEMAMCTNLLQGQASEWALLRRHSSEDLFGVQICGAYPDTIARTVELINRECTVDFIDINMGCPIDIVVNKGAGSALLMKPTRMKNVIRAACNPMGKPITVKLRTGYFEGRNRVDSLIPYISEWGATAVTIHGRSRQQRYSKLADWGYIYQCARNSPGGLQVLGNGDIFSFTDWNRCMSDCPELSTCIIARGALIKPWIFTEIKEQRHWDISSSERLNILKDFVNFGLQHWGSDTKGVETTRHFLLEWLSYTHRYIPIGLLDVIPQRLNWRPPSYYGRDELETLMASDSAADWIRISEILLGKVPPTFTFTPKHKSNAYDKAENG